MQSKVTGLSTSAASAYFPLFPHPPRSPCSTTTRPTSPTSSGTSVASAPTSSTTTRYQRSPTSRKKKVRKNVTKKVFSFQNKIIKHLRDKHGYGGASGVDTTPTTATKGPPTSAPTALSKGYMSYLSCQ